MAQLTNEQKDIIRNIVKDISQDQIIKLGGYGGTGKSTIIKVLLSVFENKGLNFLPCAYTGKAANILRKKGIAYASTIHSAIYEPYKDENNETYWHLKNKRNVTQEIDGFIVDEASMVSKEIHDDLCSFDLPIIYIGDHGQLEPIGTDFNLMKEPKYKLETIHRNAGEIAYFAEHLRKGKPSILFNCSNKVQIVQHKAVEDKHLVSTDQVICAYNKTRVQINERARIEKNINFSYISVGDKIICLRNNKTKGLFNGMQGVVKKIRKNEHFDFISDGIYYENIKYNSEQFGQETNKYISDSNSEPFDYAYCITCHKCVSEDTLLITEKGCIPIKDLWNDEEKRLQKINLNISTSNGTHKAVQIFKGNFEKAIKIKTTNGYELTGSYRHPILTWNSNKLEYEWKLLPEIKKQDIICISRNTNLFPKRYVKIKYNYKNKKIKIPNYLSEKMALILGYLVGNGHYNTKKQKTAMISLSTKDKEIKDNFFKIVKEEFDLDVKTKLIKNNKANTYYFVSKIARDYLENLGLEHVAKDKKVVPHTILRSPKNVQKIFIRGIFDTNGSAGSSCIRLVNLSLTLLKQIQIMLLNFGIISHLKESYNKKYKKNYYVLSIYGESCVAFCRDIKFGVGCKQKRLIEICKKVKGKTNKDYIPNGNNLLINFKKELLETFNNKKRLPEGLSKKTSKILSLAINNSINLSYQNLEELINETKNLWGKKIKKLEYFNLLEKIIKDFYYFDKVTSIKNTKSQMFDLSVPFNKSFIGNGFINHNSQGDQFNNVIVLEQRCNKWDHSRWCYTAASRAVNSLIWVAIESFVPNYLD